MFDWIALPDRGGGAGRLRSSQGAAAQMDQGEKGTISESIIITPLPPASKPGSASFLYT